MAILTGLIALACALTAAFVGKEYLVAVSTSNLVLHFEFPSKFNGNYSVPLDGVNHYVNEQNYLLEDKLSHAAASILVETTFMPHYTNLVGVHATFERSYLEQKTSDTFIGGLFETNAPAQITVSGKYVMNPLFVHAEIALRETAAGVLTFENTTFVKAFLDGIMAHGDNHTAHWAHVHLNMTSEKMVEYEESIGGAANVTFNYVAPVIPATWNHTGYTTEVAVYTSQEELGMVAYLLHTFGPKWETVKLAWMAVAAGCLMNAQTLAMGAYLYKDKILEKSIETVGEKIFGTTNPMVLAAADLVGVRPTLFNIIVSMGVLYFRNTFVRGKMAILLSLAGCAFFYLGSFGQIQVAYEAIKIALQYISTVVPLVQKLERRTILELLAALCILGMYFYASMEAVVVGLVAALVYLAFFAVDRTGRVVAKKTKRAALKSAILFKLVSGKTESRVLATLVEDELEEERKEIDSEVRNAIEAAEQFIAATGITLPNINVAVNGDINIFNCPGYTPCTPTAPRFPVIEEVEEEESEEVLVVETPRAPVRRVLNLGARFSPLRVPSKDD